MTTSIRLIADPVQSIAAGAIGVAYMGVGPVFEGSARMLVIQNLTDGIVMISFDGVNDHLPLPMKTQFVLTITQNDEEEAKYFALPAQTRIFVRELVIVPTTGAVYVTLFRGQDDA